MVNDSVYNTRISFKDHIKEHKPYNQKKINFVVTFNNQKNTTHYGKLLCTVVLENCR